MTEILTVIVSQRPVLIHALASVNPLPFTRPHALVLAPSWACVCQQRINTRSGMSKHACDMTQRNALVENTLLWEQRVRETGRSAIRGAECRGTEADGGRGKRYQAQRSLVFSSLVWNCSPRSFPSLLNLWKFLLFSPIARVALHCHGNDITVSHLQISLLLNTAKKEHARMW